jgi:hypothetical protein
VPLIASGPRRAVSASRKRAQRGEPLGLVGHLGGGEPAGFAQPNAQRRRQRAAPQAPLLTAAVEQRLQSYARTASHVQRTDTLRPVELVAGHAQEVDAQRADIRLDLAHGLGSVHVQPAADRVHGRGDLRQGLDRADLVVDRHDGNHGRTLIQGGGERVQVD